ncbi:MAG: c-type cytochrome [Saprospiraceae bacterium]|nr:c-type cytochrome [Saprospiraceae bacterium]
MLIFSLGQASLSAQGDPALGEGLFTANCGACHVRDMKTNATGPALGGTQQRWAEYPEEELYAWIRNSQKLISEGHPRAVELWNQWKPTVMSNFTGLSDDDIANLLAYIDGVYTGTYGKAAVAGGGEAVVAEEKKGINTPLFVGLLAALVLLSVILARIISNLNYLSELKAGNTEAKRKTLVDILTSRGVISFVIFTVVVLGGYTTVNNAIELGRQQGYQPEQPIKFSHATHSGLHKIECQYCHDGARRSKHSVIPATNTCMNCHRAIKKGSQYGTAELTKFMLLLATIPLWINT